jgi:hypothetical protein
MTHGLREYQIVLMLVVLMILFLIIAPFIPREYLAVFLNSLTITIGFAVLAAYLGPAVSGFIKTPTDRVTQLIMGITLMFTSLILNRLGVMLVPHYMGSEAFSGVAFLVFMSGVLHLSPQFHPSGKITGKLWVVVAAVIAVAAVMTPLVLWVNPHTF